MKTNVFDVLNSWIRGVEYSLVNLLSALAPWLAPLAPAYFSYHHMVNYLGLPETVAFLIAACIEILGLAAMHTTLEFYSWNRKYKDTKLHAPLWAAVLTFALYFMVIITLNVLIDATLGNEAWPVIMARALLSFLTIPSALILSIRAQHTDREEKQKRPRKKTSTQRVETPPAPTLHVPPSKSTTEAIQEYLDDNGLTPYDVGREGVMGPHELATEIGYDPNNVRPALHRMQKNYENQGS
jgi:hypothetical protein